jgi:hypothetical protein
LKKKLLKVLKYISKNDITYNQQINNGKIYIKSRFSSWFVLKLKIRIQMNRIIFLAMLLLGLTAKAQVGRVGINTASPEATLSIEVDPANALSTATSNEGVLIPKLSKARIANITTPVDATMIYVSDLTYTGTNPAVADITSKGFYYYDEDPVMPANSKWKKLNVNAGGANLYNADGALADNRTVNMNGKNLSFTGTGNVGIGKSATTDHRLEVAGSLNAEGYLRSSINDPVGGYLTLTNPQKTGNDMQDWKLFNMTGSYNKGLQFWKYSPSGVGSGMVMTLADNGNVGIGTNAPTAKFHVKDGGVYAEDGVFISSRSTIDGGALSLRNPSKANSEASNWVLYNMKQGVYGDNSLQFWRYSSDGTKNGMAMTLADNGNVGIGAGTPGLKLHVQSSHEHKIRLQHEGSADFTDLIKRSGGAFTIVNNVGGIWNGFFSIANSGNVGLGTEGPGQKLHVEGNSYMNGWLHTTQGARISGTSKPHSGADLWVDGHTDTNTLNVRSSLEAVLKNKVMPSVGATQCSQSQEGTFRYEKQTIVGMPAQEGYLLICSARSDGRYTWRYIQLGAYGT